MQLLFIYIGAECKRVLFWLTGEFWKHIIHAMRETNKYRFLYFTRYFGEFIFYTLLTVFLDDKGFNGTLVGTVLSFSPLMLALSLPLWVAADTGRTRKILVIAAAIVMMALEIVITLTPSITLIILFMVLYSVIRAPLSPSLDAMTTVFCVESGREYSVFRSYGSSGYMIAILLGSYIYGKIDFIWIVMISCVFLTGFVIMSTFVHPLEIDKDVSSEKHDYKLLFTNRDFILFLIVQVVVFAFLNVNNSYEVLYLRGRGLNTAMFGVTTLIRVTCEILTFAFLRKVKINHKLLFILMPLMMISQSLLYFFNAPVFTLFMVVVITGSASGIIIYLNNKYIARIVRPKNITVATYICVMAQNLSLALYLFLGGVVIDRLGIEFVYLFTAVIFLFGAVFVAVFFKKNPEQKI